MKLANLKWTYLHTLSNIPSFRVNPVISASTDQYKSSVNSCYLLKLSVAIFSLFYAWKAYCVHTGHLDSLLTKEARSQRLSVTSAITPTDLERNHPFPFRPYPISLIFKIARAIKHHVIANLRIVKFSLQQFDPTLSVKTLKVLPSQSKSYQVENWPTIRRYPLSLWLTLYRIKRINRPGSGNALTAHLIHARTTIAYIRSFSTRKRDLMKVIEDLDWRSSHLTIEDTAMLPSISSFLIPLSFYDWLTC